MLWKRFTHFWGIYVPKKICALRPEIFCTWKSADQKVLTLLHSLFNLSKCHQSFLSEQSIYFYVIYLKHGATFISDDLVTRMNWLWKESWMWKEPWIHEQDPSLYMHGSFHIHGSDYEKSHETLTRFLFICSWLFSHSWLFYYSWFFISCPQQLNRTHCLSLWHH